MVSKFGGGGGGGTDNQMNFEWSITPRIRTRAPSQQASTGVKGTWRIIGKR